MKKEKSLDLMSEAKAAAWSKVKMTKSGLEFKEILTFKECEKLFVLLREINSAGMWAIGDLLIHTEHAYGEMYSQMLDETDYEYKTLVNARWVAGKIEISRRREELTFGHHAAVAALEPGKQDKLLELAIKNNWSIKRMLEAVHPPALCRELECECPRCGARHAMKSKPIKEDF